MLKVPPPSTGIEALDALIGGLRRGDNVLWHDSAASLGAIFCRRFLASARERSKDVVFVTFDSSPSAVLDRYSELADYERLTIVDCFTWGKGSGSEIFTSFYKDRARLSRASFVKVIEPHRMPKVINAVFGAYAGRDHDSCLVFDSLTGTEKLWSGEDGVGTFYSTCAARLSESGAITYWLIEKAAHSKRLLARVSRAARVIVDLGLRRGVSTLTVLKTGERASAERGHPKIFHVKEGEVVIGEEGQPIAGLELGRHIKTLRTGCGLSQVELARAVGVTPSTISQVESNQISPSLSALTKMIEVMGSDLAHFFEDAARGASTPVFRAKDARPLERPQLLVDGVAASTQLPRRAGGSLDQYVLDLAPGAAIAGHFDDRKGEELLYVLDGAVELVLEGGTYRATEGDLIRLDTRLPESWRNPESEPCRLLVIAAK